MSFVVGAGLLAVVTAVTCALPGMFVVLRRDSMLVDAMSHAVLPGIVVGYLLTHDLRSPLLVIGAAVAGLLVVLGSEHLARTGLLTGDAPQGLVFPALFSIGVVLVSARATKVHLDTHAVLVGDLNLAAFEHLSVGGVSIGPRYLYVMLAVLLLVVVFLAATWPRLVAATFDASHATLLGLRAPALGTALMFLVAVTVTAGFHAAGAVLVVALVVVPGATALLLARSVAGLLAWTVVVAVGGAVAGFAVAYLIDAPTSAAMAVLYGAVFAVVLIAVRGRDRRRRRPRARATAARV